MRPSFRYIGGIYEKKVKTIIDAQNRNFIKIFRGAYTYMQEPASRGWGVYIRVHDPTPIIPGLRKNILSRYTGQPLKIPFG